MGLTGSGKRIDITSDDIPFGFAFGFEWSFGTVSVYYYQG